MKTHSSWLLLVASLMAARCGAAPLPSACGNDKIIYDVSTQAGRPAPSPPAEGKAQIVIVEVKYGLDVTARIGLDGQWVGADKGDSYFAFDVSPGVHHMCANWQSSLRSWDRQVGLLALNAEAGKVYYFEVKVIMSKYFNDFTFTPLNEDEGRYLVSTGRLATATAKAR